MLVTDSKLTLREKLREKREDTGRSQSDIGDRLGLEQATVSAYERSDKRLRRRGPEWAQTFIAAYGFTDAEARQLTRDLFADAYADLFGATVSAASADNEVRYIGTLSKIKATIDIVDLMSTTVMRRSVPTWVAEKYDLNDIAVAAIDAATLATATARQRVPADSELYVHTAVEPKPGDVVVIHVDGHYALIVSGESDYSVLESYDYSQRPVMTNAPYDVFGVVLGMSRPMR